MSSCFFWELLKIGDGASLNSPEFSDGARLDSPEFSDGARLDSPEFRDGEFMFPLGTFENR